MQAHWQNCSQLLASVMSRVYSLWDMPPEPQGLAYIWWTCQRTGSQHSTSIWVPSLKCEVCVYSLACVCICSCICCVCACVCNEARDQWQVSFSIIPQPILWLFLLLNPEVHDWPDWLASKLEDLPVSPSPLLLGLQMYAAMPGFLHGH